MIINGNSRFDELKSLFGDLDYIASDYITYEWLKPSNVKYLYEEESSGSDEKLNNIYRASLNWYKNSDGRNIFTHNGVSFGPVIARSVSSSFANDYRNYIAFKRLLEKYDGIYLNEKSAPSFHRVASIFEDKISWYDFEEEINIHRASSPVRTVINQFPIIHPLSKYIRLLQKPIMFFLKNKNLIFSDWTYDSIFKKRKDCLLLNSMRPWQGYYLFEYEYFTKESEQTFPDEIPLDLINLNRVCKRFCELNIGWDDDLIKLFTATIIRVYRNSFKHLRRTYILYKTLFSYYKPKSIVIPGETHFAYLIAVQIARGLDIKTILAIDGYHISKDESCHFFLEKKGDYVFDKYVAYGNAHKDLLVKYEGIPESRVVVSRSPLVCSIRKKACSKYNNYVIVVAYSPTQTNPDSRWDKRLKIAYDIVKCIIKTDDTKILIKIKSGSESEYSFYHEYFSRFNLLNDIEIVGGDFNEYVGSAKYVVGQLSTSLFESIIAKKPYYIYEPYENGLPNSSLSSSSLVQLKDVSRNINELEVAIVNGRSYHLDDNKYVVDGPGLDVISL